MVWRSQWSIVSTFQFEWKLPTDPASFWQLNCRFLLLMSTCKWCTCLFDTRVSITIFNELFTQWKTFYYCHIQMFFGQWPKTFPKEERWCLLEVCIRKKRFKLQIQLHQQGIPTGYWGVMVCVTYKMQGVWIADITSVGNFSSSALSKISTSGIIMLSQNCCNWLSALSAFFTPSKTLAATAALIFGNLIQQEFETPFLVAFAILLSLSSLELKSPPGMLQPPPGMLQQLQKV